MVLGVWVGDQQSLSHPSSTWATCNRQNTLEPVYAAPPASDHTFLLHSAEVSLKGMPRDAWSLAMQPQHNSQQGLTGWQTGAVGPQKSTSPLGIRCLHPHDGDALPPCASPITTSSPTQTGATTFGPTTPASLTPPWRPSFSARE